MKKPGAKRRTRPWEAMGIKSSELKTRGSRHALLCASCIESLLLLNNFKIFLTSITSYKGIVSGFHD